MQLLSSYEWIDAYKMAFKKVRGVFTFDPDSGSHSDYQGLRMSGIGKCARRQYYELVTDRLEGDRETSWPSAMGYAGQELIAAALLKMGYTLYDQEKEVEWAGMRGHMDGMLTSFDLGSSKAVWDSKIRRNWSFVDYIRYGLPRAEVETYCQQQCYIAATGADAGFVTVVPHDLSAARGALKQCKIEAEVDVHREVIRPDAEAHELLEERATMLYTARDAELLPDREYDPERNDFECRYCPFMSRCLSDGGDRTFQVTPIPSHWSSL